MKKMLCGLQLVAVCFAWTAVALDGTWESASGGVWSDTSKWTGGDVAADSGLAAFEVAAGVVSVTNDITGLSLSGLAFNAVFGNQADWFFAGREIALANNPTVNVADGRAEFNAGVRSTTMLAKTGAGALFFEAGLVSDAGVTLQDGVLEVRSGRELGTGRFNWNGGVVKVVPGEAGLQESSSPNGSINAGTYGTNIAVTLDLRMADLAVCDQYTYPQNTQYIYRGRWYVPADGVYSFMKDFDDAGYLAIDNVVLINNGAWNDLVVVRDVTLRQGWHDIDLRVAQGSGGVGPQKGFPYGIMYDPLNGDFSSTSSALPFVDPGDGSVLRTDMFSCILPLTFLTGDVTLDASAMPGDYTPMLVRGVQTNAAAATVPKLTVVGGDGRLLVGSQSLYGNTSLHAVFNVDVDAPNGVLFGNKVALYRLPSCDWEILPRSDILIGTDEILGTGPLTLTNFNVRIISEDALGGQQYPITVKGTGNRVFFDPTDSVNGSWGNALTLTLSHDVSLEGEKSAVVFTGRGTCYYDGVISGIGSLIKDSSSTVHLRGASTFEGDVQISGGRLNVYTPTIGVATNPVLLTNGGTLSFASAVTEPYVHSLGGTTGTLDILAGQTVTLNDLSMATLTIFGVGTLCISNILPTVRLSVSGNIKLIVPDEAELSYISLATDGLMLDITGGSTLGSVSGTGTIVKRGDTAMVFTGAAAFDGSVVVAEGSLAIDLSNTAAFPSPAFWLDASRPETLDHTRKDNGVDLDKNIVTRWSDWRDNGRYAEVENPGVNGAENFDRPYLLDNELNGLPVISCGPFTDPPEVHQYRRMKFSNLACTRVIMVFGSQHGGGHILGVADGQNAIFARGVDTITTPPVASDPIWKTATYPVRLGGVAVDGLTTGFNGDYQIVNVTLSPSQVISAIGMLNYWNNAGGQRYAEILFFTGNISDAEARFVEGYLGSKWGVPGARVGRFTVQAGAKLLVDGALQIDSLLGDGTVVKTGEGPLRIAGQFDGVIDVQGGSLEPIGLPPPPSVEELPLDNMQFWLDACETDRITCDPNPGQVFQWIDRRPSVNRFAYSFWGGSYRERPWLVQTPNPRGGTPLTWVDFIQNFAVDPADSESKYMKIRFDVDPVGYVQDTQGTDNNQYCGNIRTGFLVLDSLRGGGQPFDNNFTRDEPRNVASTPVWGGNTSAPILNGQTRLDGIPINGRQTGFNGGVQVLSFTTTGDTRFNNLACSKKSLERLGEGIFFNAALSADVRRAYEAYLLSKWKGISGPGYHYPGDRLASAVTLASGVTLDLTPFNAGEIGAVSGPGTLRITDLAALPPINGTLGGLDVLGDITLDVSTQGATPDVSITGTLTVPPTGTLTLNFTEQVKPGSIQLFAYGTLTGNGFSNWTLALTGDTPNGAIVRLRQTSTATYADIIAGGTLLMIR